MLPHSAARVSLPLLHTPLTLVNLSLFFLSHTQSDWPSETLKYKEEMFTEWYHILEKDRIALKKRWLFFCSCHHISVSTLWASLVAAVHLSCRYVMLWYCQTNSSTFDSAWQTTCFCLWCWFQWTNGWYQLLHVCMAQGHMITIAVFHSVLWI